MEVFISGTQTSWHWNDFFKDNDDTHRYQPFFPFSIIASASGVPPPSASFGAPTPAPAKEPGRIPPADGAGAFACHLDRVTYTARYGGSVELLFREKEHTGFEVRSGPYLWDLQDLNLRLYVTPTAQGLQSPGVAVHQGNVSCDAYFAKAVCYSLPSPGSYNLPAVPLKALPDAHLPHLRQALSFITRKIASDLSHEARRFVGGFLWSQFPEFFGPGQIVEGLNISDNLFEPFTRQGRPLAIVDAQVANMVSGSEESTDEIRVEMESRWVMDGARLGGNRATYRMQDTVGLNFTPWFRVAIFDLDTELPAVSSLLLTLSGFERDDLSGDDFLEEFHQQIELVESTFRNAHASNSYGLLDEPEPIRVRMPFEDGSAVLSADLRLRFVLGIR